MIWLERNKNELVFPTIGNTKKTAEENSKSHQVSHNLKIEKRLFWGPAPGPEALPGRKQQPAGVRGRDWVL